MMRFQTRTIASFLLAATASLVGAQQQRPTIRQLGAVEAKTSEPLGNLAGIRALGGGGVLVNDVARRRVLLFDPTLTKFIVVADSTSATSNAYSGRMAGLISYRGDSTLFVDPASLSMLVIDGAGNVGRVMSVPRSEDAMALASPAGGATFDGSGKIVYRANPRFQMRGGGPAGARGGAPGGGRPGGGALGAGFTLPEPPDSAFIVRIDLATRNLDTVGVIRTPKVKLDMTRDDKGNISVTTQINPLPVVDDWAVLPDGSVAVVRGRDYHVDWFNADGTKTSAAKIPFDWQRLTDEDKVAFIDSVKAARERMGSGAPVPLTGGIGGGAPGGGGGAATGGQVIVMGMPGAPAQGGADGSGPRPSGGGGGFTMGAPQVNYIPASELPDYKPPFFAGSVRSDPDGNLWIRTIPTAAIAGGPVYDVINRRGELIDRVQIPPGRTIVGFGSGGYVYLTNREATSTSLERARVR